MGILNDRVCNQGAGMSAIRAMVEEIKRLRIINHDLWAEEGTKWRHDLHQEAENICKRLEVPIASQEEKLKSLDALYLQYTSLQHQATWGGTYEREHYAAQELKPVVNALFDGLLKLLEERTPTDFRGRPKTFNEATRQETQ